MINGWLESTGLRLYDLVDQYIQHGLEYITCTDIGMDGMLSGPNFDLYKNLKTRFPKLKVNASGGVTSLNDITKLKSLSIDGIIIGKALYEQRIKLTDLKPFLC
jgi:phosphoribosylformimino-5-aminoimidazole carboxamide ribotide isomerase